MGRHKQSGHEDRHFFRRGTADGISGGTATRQSKLLSWTFAAVGLAVWSFVASIAYALVDPILAWIAANAGLLWDSGKGVATATGFGKEAGSLVDNLNLDVTGFLGQAIALLRIAAKPAIMVLWAIGALAIIAAPMILPRVARLLVRRRH